MIGQAWATMVYTRTLKSDAVSGLLREQPQRTLVPMSQGSITVLSGQWPHTDGVWGALSNLLSTNSSFDIITDWHKHFTCEHCAGFGCRLCRPIFVHLSQQHKSHRWRSHNVRYSETETDRSEAIQRFDLEEYKLTHLYGGFQSSIAVLCCAR